MEVLSIMLKKKKSWLLCFILMCAANFAWVRPFEPDVRFSNIRAEQRDGTLKRNVIRVELLVSNKCGNTIWFASNEHGLIPSDVMLADTLNRNGEEKRIYVRYDTGVYAPYDTNQQSERKRWRRVAPRQTIELHTEILELPYAEEFVMEFDVHDWRGRTVNVRTPVITVPESPSGPKSDD
jgi:hypothetical protein